MLRLGYRSIRIARFSQLLAKQFKAPLGSDCLLSCAPKEKRNALIAPVVLTGVVSSYFNEESLLSFHLGSLLVKCEFPLLQQTIQKRQQFSFQRCFLLLSYLQSDLEIPIHLPVHKARNKLSLRDKRQEKTRFMFYL